MGADQQRFLAGAIDEQIPRHALAGIERNRGDVSIGIRLDCLDIAGDVAHAKFPDRVPMQQSGECAGVEVVAIVDGECVLRRVRLLWREAKLDHPRLGGHQVGEAGASAMGEPELRRIELGVFQRQAEGMEVFRGFRQARPSAEPRALLEAGGAFADELILGEADSLERGAHRRPGAFAHADDGHIGRFDQRDLDHAIAAFERFGGDHAGGDPARRAAAHDDDFPRWPIHRITNPALESCKPCGRMIQKRLPRKAAFCCCAIRTWHALT